MKDNNKKVKTENKSCEVIELRYFAMALPNQNCMHEEIKCRLNSKNVSTVCS